MVAYHDHTGSNRHTASNGRVVIQILDNLVHTALAGESVNELCAKIGTARWWRNHTQYHIVGRSIVAAAIEGFLNEVDECVGTLLVVIIHCGPEATFHDFDHLATEGTDNKYTGM